MDAKETVKQGLQARKDVRAAEARAEKLKEDLAAVNDARFCEQLNHQKDRRTWQREREILVGDVYRQRLTIRQLREENEQLRQNEAYAKQASALAGAMRAVVILALLIVARDQGWIVSWLAASLTAVSATYLFFATFFWVRSKK